MKPYPSQRIPLVVYFLFTEFEVASRYFENLQHHMADSEKSNIYLRDSRVSLQGKLTGSSVNRCMIVEKEHRLLSPMLRASLQSMGNNNWNNSSRDCLTVLLWGNVQSILSRSCNFICPRTTYRDQRIETRLPTRRRFKRGLQSPGPSHSYSFVHMYII